MCSAHQGCSGLEPVSTTWYSSGGEASLWLPRTRFVKSEGSTSEECWHLSHGGLYSIRRRLRSDCMIARRGSNSSDAAMIMTLLVALRNSHVGIMPFSVQSIVYLSLGWVIQIRS